MHSKILKLLPFFVSTLIVFALIAVPAFAQGAQAAHPIAKVQVLGPEDVSSEITVNVWLKQHNKAEFDQLVHQMYDKNSPSFHHFLTMAQYQARFAPTADNAAAVRSFLASHNLRVTAADKENHYITAHGSIADMQRAFSTQINRVMLNGAVHRLNTTEAAVTGPAVPLVAAVQGLSDLGYRSYSAPAFDPETRKPYAGVRPSAAGSDGLFFSAECMRSPETHTFTTNGGTPSATYTGNRYGSDISSPPPNLPPCGYDAAEIHTAYKLNPLYQNGLNGHGQTIVIVDAFGSNTIRADANLFSQLNQLPALTFQNFHVYRPNGAAVCTPQNGCIAGNWQFETTLDVEWAHAIAPGANIALVLGEDNSFTNLDIANLFAIENELGTVVSNSFGISEIALDVFLPSEVVVEDGISEIAAALGISLNVSSGDFGDSLAVDNNAFGINAVSPQSNDSSFATVVGGTSTFLAADHHIKFQTGWGLNFVRIAEPNPNPPTIPPLFFGFQSGSGGGTSYVIPKPAYQSALSGDFRKVPDIAMNADPETGNEIIVTPDSIPGHDQFVEVFGGTSLACPMFSALWAIANQAAGGGPIGEAAPILYSLPTGAITDVLQLNSQFNVTGVINNPPNPPVNLSAKTLAQPLGNTNRFVSALFQSPSSSRWDVFTFGTDSSLTTGPGWDNVTGLGTPNGATFIQDVVAAVQ